MLNFRILYVASLFLILAFISPLHAQPLSRDYVVEGYGITCNTAKVTADGNIVLAGTKTAGNLDHWVYAMKVNVATGDTLWSRSFRQTGKLISGVCMDELTGGDLVIGVSIQDSAVFYAAPKMMLLDLHADGSVNWTKCYLAPYPFSSLSVTVVKQLPFNNFMVCGTTSDSAGILIQKMNSNGDTLFSRGVLVDGTQTLSGASVSDLVATGDGFVFSGQAEFSNDGINLLLFKTDTTGNVQWLKSDFLNFSVTLYAGGFTRIVLNADSTMVVAINNQATLLLKIDQLGHPAWLKHVSDTSIIYGEPSMVTLSKAPDGGFFIGGTADGHQNGNVTTRLPPGNFAGKQSIIKTDANAFPVWGKKYSAEKNFNTAAFTAVLADSSLVAAGTIYDTLLPSAVPARQHFYFMHLDQAGTSAADICGLDTVMHLTSQVIPYTLYDKPFHFHNGGYYLADTLSSDAEHPATHITDLVPMVTISSSPALLCAGATASISAAGINAGTSANYNFMVNGVTQQNGPASTYATSTLSNGDNVYCVMTSNAACLASDSTQSNPLTLQIWPTADPTVTITASPGTVVGPGVPVTFTATVTNGGPAPTYAWQKNSVYTGPNAPNYTTYFMSSGSYVTCTVTSSACAAHPVSTSNQLSVSVTTGVDQLQTPAVFSFAPNPARDYVIIKRATAGDASLMIRDVEGRKRISRVIHTKEEKIDISLLTPGTYFVELESTQGRSTVELIKN